MGHVRNVNFLEIENYDASALLEEVKKRLNLKTDAALSRMLNVKPPCISKIRHGINIFPTYVMLRINELTGLSYKEMRQIMNEPDWRD